MTNEREKNAYDQLLQGIQSFVKKCVNESNRDITTTARIISIQSDGSYNIDLNGVEYKNIDTIGGECTLNEMVRVVIPQGQYNNMFILKGGVSSTDYNTLKGRVDTNEDNIAMLDGDVEGLITDVGTLKTDMTTVKGAVTTIQDSLNDKLSKTETATKATADASGNTITTSYASTIEISGNILTLKSKSGVVLKTATLPSSTLQWNE